MKKAFSLVELIIVVAILGILAAVVIPTFKDNVKEAKESAAKDSLRILRNTIEYYAAQHSDIPPGYLNGSIFAIWYLPFQFKTYTDINGNASETASERYCYGPYLKDIPENPFNNQKGILIIQSTQTFSSLTTKTTGWLYNPATKEIRIDWSGTDTQGKDFADY